MRLSRPIRGLLIFIFAIILVVLLEFRQDLDSGFIILLVVVMLGCAGCVAYFVGKEMSPLHNVTAVLLCCFIALFIQLNRVQVLQADKIENVAGNNRQLQRDFGQARGKIITADGQVVALSEPVVNNENFDFRRRYPHGDLYAHSVGYVSLTLGSSGVEEFQNDELVVSDTLSFGPKKTSDVILTLDHDLQTVAREALKDPANGNDRLGSVVALDPKNGEIKALWSYPSFNPEPLASLSSEEIQDAIDLLQSGINEDRPSCTDTPQCAKAYQDRTVPGSTFKVIVAAGALDRAGTGISLSSPTFPTVNSYKLPFSGSVSNYGGGSCGGDLQTLIRRSCNAGFSQIAVEDLGPEKMVAQAEAFGFNQKIPLDVDASNIVESFYPSDYGNFISESRGFRLFDNSDKLGQTAIGQSDVQASPLNMAMVAGAIANDGDMMVPRFVEGYRDSDSLDDSYRPIKNRRWKESTTTGTARDLQNAMYGVVESGTAKGLQVSGLAVGAKTGTADIGDDVHAWVIAFAGPPNSDPELAVAVLVERQKGQAGVTGGKVAVPIAKLLFEEYFNINDR